LSFVLSFVLPFDILIFIEWTCALGRADVLVNASLRTFTCGPYGRGAGRTEGWKTGTRTNAGSGRWQMGTQAEGTISLFSTEIVSFYGYWVGLMCHMRLNKEILSSNNNNNCKGTADTAAPWPSY
jgi:hypothetical protein